MRTLQIEPSDFGLPHRSTPVNSVRGSRLPVWMGAPIEPSGKTACPFLAVMIASTAIHCSGLTIRSHEPMTGLPLSSRTISPLSLRQPHIRGLARVMRSERVVHWLPSTVLTPSCCQPSTIECMERPMMNCSTAFASSGASTGSSVSRSSSQPNGRVPPTGLPSSARDRWDRRIRRLIFRVSILANATPIRPMPSTSSEYRSLRPRASAYTRPS